MTHGHDKKKEKQGKRKNEMIILFNLMRGCVQEEVKYLNQVQCAFILIDLSFRGMQRAQMKWKLTRPLHNSINANLNNGLQRISAHNLHANSPSTRINIIRMDGSEWEREQEPENE